MNFILSLFYSIESIKICNDDISKKNEMKINCKRKK